ncbi:MAG: DUF975 family protein [Oscillospiraceae bacterium]|nr:DUF975 family protein [Oscillospiraceae bacterium]
MRVEVKKEARDILSDKWGKAISIMAVHGVTIYVIAFILSFIPFVGFVANFALRAVILYNLVITFMKFKRGEEVGVFDIVTKIPENFYAAWKVCFGIFLKMWMCGVVIIGLFIARRINASLYSSAIPGEQIETLFSTLSALLPIATFVIIVLTIAKSLYYIFTWEILFDSKNAISGKKAAEKSELLMQDRRWEYFVFQLSFFGWVILAMTPMIISSAVMISLGMIGSGQPTLLPNLIINILMSVGYLWLTPYMRVAKTGFYEKLLLSKEEEVKE